MTRVLFMGDSAGTGFGTVTRDLGTGLLALGLEVRFLSLNEQAEELEEPFKGRTAVVGASDGWLATGDPVQTATAIARLETMFTGGLFEDGWTPEAAIILGDVASLKVSPVLNLIPEGFPAFHYVPIEGDGLPPRWAWQVWSKARPVAMSEWGATEIEKLGLPRPPVVYHGVNTDDFYPVSEEHPVVITTTTALHVIRSKAEAKEFFGLDPKLTVLLRTDRHMPRKMYGSLLRSLAPVLAKHLDARFIYHCRTIDQGGDLDDERSKYGPYLGDETAVRSDGEVFRFPKFGGLASHMLPTRFADMYGGVDRKVLTALYNAADIYVSNSAEGFGLTIAEALACGVPAVGVDYSSVPEVIGPAGIRVPIISPIDNVYSYFWCWVDERKFAEAVERLVVDRDLRWRLRAKGPAHIKATFRWDRAAEQFAALIEAAVRQEKAA